MFCFVVIVRLVLYSSIPLFYDRQPFKHFEGFYYASDVIAELYSFCIRETETLCEGGRWNHGETCTTDVWGVPFGAILGMNEQSTPGGQALNCSVLAHTDVVQDGLELVERERKAAVEKMTTIFRTLLRRIVASGDDFDSSEPFALPWKSIGTLYVLRFYCLFVYDDNPMNGWKVPGKISAWNTVIMSNSTLWTEDAFFDLLTQAIEKIETEQSTKHYDTSMMYDGGDRERGIDFKADPRTQAADLLQFIERIKNGFTEHIDSVSVAICPFLPGTIPAGVDTKVSHILFAPQELNDCMLSYYGQQLAVFSTRCMEAMTEAPAKLVELEMEEHGGFLLVSKLTFLGVSVACCLVLSFLLNNRHRLEKRLERRRRQLQQELNDPFLRNSLQHKPGSISEEERVTLISRLEDKVTTWDSKSRALYLSRLYIRRFRWLVIFTMTATTLVYFFFHVFHVSSMPAYLNTLAMLLAMLTASYRAPTEDGGENGLPSREERLELVDVGVHQSIPQSQTEMVIT